MSNFVCACFDPLWPLCLCQVMSLKLLDSEFSDPALRAFFIPLVSEHFVRHGLLELYKRIEADENID